MPRLRRSAPSKKAVSQGVVDFNRPTGGPLLGPAQRGEAGPEVPRPPMVAALAKFGRGAGETRT